MGLDRRLQRVGAAQNPGRDRVKQRHHHDQQAGEPPIIEQRRRQQHEQRDEGGAILAKERQPQAEHRVRALEHRLQQPAGMNIGVKAQRQIEHMVEIFAPSRRAGSDAPADRHKGRRRWSATIENRPKPAQAATVGRKSPQVSAAPCAWAPLIRSMMRPNRIGSANCAPASARLATTRI